MISKFRWSAILLILLSTAALAAQEVEPAGEQLHRLLSEHWEWTLREYPEAATIAGDSRYNDRLTDCSAEAIERRKVEEGDFLERIKAIDRSQLEGQDVLSYDVFLDQMQRAVDEQRFPMGRLPLFQGSLMPFELMPVSTMYGLHLEVPKLARTSPFETVKDYENYLSRLADVSSQVDQTIALLRRGMETGWVQDASPMRGVLAQLEGQRTDDVTTSGLYVPFLQFPDRIEGAERERLAKAGQDRIRNSVLPAFDRLHDFILHTYIPACRDGGGASSQPGGAAYYQALIGRYTTTSLTPKEIHEIGLGEVARIQAEQTQIARKMGHEGSLRQFSEMLREDPNSYYADSEQILIAYRDLAKRADAMLPGLFAELPRAPYGVRAKPAYEGQSGEYYTRGAMDGSRAGYVNVNAAHVKARTKYDMAATMLHEGVPGHHLQVSRAQEMDGLPEFRRRAFYSAYAEGWGLYAESLGEEMGFYDDPLVRFGQLNMELHRACRLVVDTGLHAFGWTRQQAIEYMLANTALTEAFVPAEVDRYLGWPGQALAYKIGELKFKELRARASAALGEDFDLRRFHNALIDDGALPLNLLESRIDAWIESEKAKSGSPR